MSEQTCDNRAEFDDGYGKYSQFCVEPPGHDGDHCNGLRGDDARTWRDGGESERIKPYVTVADLMRMPALVDIPPGAVEYMRRCSEQMTTALRSAFVPPVTGWTWASDVAPEETARMIRSVIDDWRRPAPPLRPAYPDRSAIDAALREDARRYPAFATARRAAVMAACERQIPPPVAEIQTALAAFHAYEAARGGGRVDISERAPFTDAWRLLRDMTQDISIPATGTCWRHYEAARGMR